MGIAAANGTQTTVLPDDGFIKIDGFVGLDSTELPDFKHMKPECVKGLKEYAKKEAGLKKPGQMTTKDDCEKGSQACHLTMTLTIPSQKPKTKKATKCFPAVCEQKNIKLEVEAA